MDFIEKRQLLNRILSGIFLGKVEVQSEIYFPEFKDPDMNVKIHSDFVYKNAIDEAKTSGVFTLDESYKVLTDNGTWTAKLENELITLEKDIPKLQKAINSFKFQKAKQRMTAEALKAAKLRVSCLLDIKNQLYTSTAEFLAEQAQRRYIIQNITKNIPQHLLEDKAALSTLIVYYYKEGQISEPKVRELARTDPWRLYWAASKGTGNPIFNRPLCDITDLQYLLLAWTKIYDFAFECTNRPSDDIVNNDEMFDSWYKEEIERLDKERRAETHSLKVPDAQEVFIPADAEGAKEVYELNDAVSRSKIKQREAFLEKKGIVNESELPDTQKDLKMQANRLAASRGQNG